MKKFFSTMLIAAAGVCTYGQDKNEVKLSDLTAPSIPAFTILGVQPSEIAQPKTLEALEASLYSNFYDNGNIVLPKNYALEFTPYWFKPHPYITFDRYLKPSFCQSFGENSSFSLASYEQSSFSDSTKKNVRMGFGYRTMIDYTHFEKSEEYVELLFKLRKGMVSVSQAMAVVALVTADTAAHANAATLKQAFGKGIENMKSTNKSLSTQESRDELDNIAKEFIFKTIDKTPNERGDTLLNRITRTFASGTEAKLKSKEMTDTLSKIINNRYGFRVEGATAMVLDFPTNVVSFSRVPKWGVWLTPSYRFKSVGKQEQNAFELLGVIRYSKNFLPVDSNPVWDVNFANNVDFGGKLVFETGKFSINAEYVQRWQKTIVSSEQVGNLTYEVTKKAWDYKATINATYRLSDKLALTYSFGKNYEINTENPGNIISQLSLNFSPMLADEGNLKK